MTVIPLIKNNSKGKMVRRAKPQWPSWVLTRRCALGSCYAVEEGSANIRRHEQHGDHGTASIPLVLIFAPRQMLVFRLRKYWEEGSAVIFNSCYVTSCISFLLPSVHKWGKSGNMWPFFFPMQFKFNDAVKEILVFKICAHGLTRYYCTW